MLVVCTPAAGMAAARQLLDPLQALFPFVLAADEEIAGRSLAPAPGWFRQMILKLAFGFVCTTPYYLTLDADLVLARPAGQDAFFAEGRANTKFEAISRHPSWWQAACDLLHAPPPPFRFGLSVTPNMLAAELARAALQLLEERQGAPWAAVLAQRSDHAGCPWTEYALYTVAAETRQALGRWHLRADEAAAAGLPELICNFNVWGEADVPMLLQMIESGRFAEHLASGLFFVLQSNFALDIARHGPPLARALLG